MKSLAINLEAQTHSRPNLELRTTCDRGGRQLLTSAVSKLVLPFGRRMAALVIFAFCCGEVTMAGVEENFGYSVNPGGASVSIFSYNGPDGAVVIPSKLPVYDPVTESDVLKTVSAIEGGFFGRTGLTSLTIPSSVTSIGSSAFRDCSGLTSLTIPSSVTSIGSSAFSGCTGLTSLTIPSSVTSIGSSAFSECSGLTSLTIPDSVTTIDDSAFYGCVSLKNLTIGESVTAIGNAAFYDCGSLTNLTIPSSVTSILDNAFRGCSSLTSLSIPKSGTSLTNSVITIGYSAFRGCSRLTNLMIGERVTSIGELAFQGCGSLTSLSIPDSVTSIQREAFSGCSSLTNLTLGDNVTIIGDSAFHGCSSLRKLIIPDRVTTIETNAFYGQNFDGQVIFLGNAPLIGSSVFRGRDSNSGSCELFFDRYASGYTAPSWISYNMNHIHAMTGKAELIQSLRIIFDDEQEVTITGCSIIGALGPDGIIYAYWGGISIPNFIDGKPVTRIGDHAFTEEYFLPEVGIPSTVNSIGEFAFSGCRSLTSLTIPSSVTEIGAHAFAGCTGLTSVTIPSGVNEIKAYTFSGCTGLTDVTIPDNITAIYNSAFADCTGLLSASYMGEVPSMGRDVFHNASVDFTVLYDVNQADFTSPIWHGYNSMPYNGTAPSELFPFVIETSSTTARLGGKVVNDGGMPPTTLGVVYSVASLNGNPRIGGIGVTNVAATDIFDEFFNVTASSLLPGNAYVFSVYATNIFGTGYSSIVSFTTSFDPLFDFDTTYEYCFDGTPYDLRVGNQVTFNFDRLITTGQTVKLSGKLPTGLKYTPETGLLTGTISGKASVYQTVVQIYSGRTLVHTIPFPITVLDFPSSLIGNFDAILEDADENPKGALHLTITKSNAWSATLESAGSGKRSAKGTFILGEGLPTALIIADFPATSTALAETILLTLDGDVPNFTGTHNHGTLRGFRLASGTELPATPSVCTVVLDAGDQDGISSPAGFGWLKGSVSKAGIGALKGILGDGTAARITLRVSPSGQAVLWAQPYSNKNSRIGGIVTLSNIGLSSGDDDVLAEGLQWLKLAEAKTLSYPNGFGPLVVNLVSSRWIPPSTASSLGASLGWRNERTVSAIIQGAGISNQELQATTKLLPTEFTMNDKFNLVASVPDSSSRVAWSGKATAKDGGFAGVFTIPTGFSSETGSGSAAASGVLLQVGPWESVTGCGLIKIPIAGVKGGFRTAAFILGQ
jgi:hypothetical protein